MQSLFVFFHIFGFAHARTVKENSVALQFC